MVGGEADAKIGDLALTTSADCQRGPRIDEKKRAALLAEDARRAPEAFHPASVWAARGAES